MLSNFGNNWIQKIPLTAKFTQPTVQLSQNFFSSNYFQIGHEVHFLISNKCLVSVTVDTGSGT